MGTLRIALENRKTLHYVNSAHVWQGNVQYNYMGIGVRHFRRAVAPRIKAVTCEAPA